MRSWIALAGAAAIAWTVPAAAGQPLAAAPIASIAPDHAGFADLAALRAAIGDRRIVMLGEASHGDGSTFLAKTRLVRFLVERMGFDLIAFESGFWDLDLAQRRLAAGEATGTVLGEAVFPLWSASDQFQPLNAFLGQRRAAGRPVAVAGFDLQFTGRGAKRLPDELRALGRAYPRAAPALARLAGHVQLAVDRVPGGLAKMDEAALDRDLATIRAALTGGGRAAFWRQALASIGANLKFQKNIPGMAPATFDLRERQMASNLEWLARHNPDKKIIVWAATSHILRDRTAIDVSEAKEMVPMGAYFARTPLGRQSYVLAFTAAEGKVGSMRRGTSDVEPAPAGSYEAELAARGLDAAFVDLSRRAAERRIGRMLGYAPWTGDWRRAVDGLFFIRTMQPTSYAQSAQSSPMSR